jgi:hypothetical protein
MQTITDQGALPVSIASRLSCAVRTLRSALRSGRSRLFSAIGAPTVRATHLVTVGTLGAWFALAASPALAASANCPNVQFRTGPSANLPDCRAYELVTPDTNGIQPSAVTIGGSNTGAFATDLASPNGRSVIFVTSGGSLSGTDGNGTNDEYEAVRTSEGWVINRRLSPSGAQSELPEPGGVSPDHQYSFWAVTNSFDQGTLAGGRYVGMPNGTFDLIGRGSLFEDPLALGTWITAGASHVIFTSDVQLEPDAPPSGAQAVYDRTPTGLHVVSVLPGGATPISFASYQGVSANGSVVLFSIGGNLGKLNGDDAAFYAPLYARRGDATTVTVARNDTVMVGRTLSCTAGPGDATTTDIQWLRDGAPISGASSATYTTASADAGTLIQCQVFALNSNAGSTQASTPAVAVEPFPATEPPIPPGSVPAPSPAGPAGGDTETCDTGSWQGSPNFTYQWYVNGAAVSGATASTYTVQAADVPGAIQCAVTDTNAGGSVTAVSAITNTSTAPSPAAPSATASTGNLNIVPAGASDDGSKVFYVQGSGGGLSPPVPADGDIVSFDTGTQTAALVNDSADAVVVNISADGSHVYFISPSQLDGPNGTLGADNLYVWDGVAVRFVATLDAADASGTSFGQFNLGLEQWTSAVVSPRPDQLHGPLNDPSRTTPDGKVFVFESYAPLTSYESAGHSEIYRYDDRDRSLVCVSCDSSGAPPTSDARLELPGNPVSGKDPLTAVAIVHNLSDDGSRVFFETDDSLVTTDVDGGNDVYEWDAGIVGAQPHRSLISSGHTTYTVNSFTGQVTPSNLLYAVTPDGNDVIFRTGDPLVAEAGGGGTPVLYDAKVGGGFGQASAPAPCAEDACQGQSSPEAPAPTAASITFSGPGNAALATRVTVLSRVVHGSRFVLRVRVPAKGRITITGHGIRTVRRSVATEGIYRVRVKLTRHAAGALHRRHSLSLKLRVRYAPASGRASIATVRLTVLPVRHRHRRNANSQRVSHDGGGIK